MKIIIAMMLGLICATGAYADEYHQFHQLQLEQAQQLPRLAKQYFAGSKGASFEDGFTLDDIFDQERAMMRAKLHVGFSIAIDSGVHVTGLGLYGMKQIDGKLNRYQVDYQQSPQWLEERLLFLGFSLPEYFDDSTEQGLARKGLSRADLARIKQYIVDNNIHLINQQSVLELLPKTERLLGLSQHKNDKVAIAAEFARMMRLAERQNWNLWVKELLMPFARVKQQAIFEYAKNNMGVAHVSASNEKATKWLYLADRIESGLFKQETHQQINTLKSHFQRYQEEK